MNTLYVIHTRLPSNLMTLGLSGSQAGSYQTTHINTSKFRPRQHNFFFKYRINKFCPQVSQKRRTYVKSFSIITEWLRNIFLIL